MNTPQFVWMDEIKLNAIIKIALNNLHLSETANDYQAGVVPCVLAETEGNYTQYNVAKILNNLSEMLWFLEEIQKELFYSIGEDSPRKPPQKESTVVDRYVFLKYLLWKLNQAGILETKHKEVVEIEIRQCWINMLFADQQEALRRTARLEAV